jgi:hypothetical protein
VYAATRAHYGVVGDPARVRDPNRKGTVEHAIGHTQATALKGRRFESIEAQNEFLAHWEKNWTARRIHGTERRQVQAMLEEERAHLKALPLLGMRYFEEAVRTVCEDRCVRMDHSSYAARPAGIGSKVLVRIFAQRIEIGEHASRLCELLFAIEGRVGQRKLWGIVSLARRYPAQCVDTACAQALEQGKGSAATSACWL